MTLKLEPAGISREGTRVWKYCLGKIVETISIYCICSNIGKLGEAIRVGISFSKVHIFVPTFNPHSVRRITVILGKSVWYMQSSHRAIGSRLEHRNEKCANKLIFHCNLIAYVLLSSAFDVFSCML